MPIPWWRCLDCNSEFYPKTIGDNSSFECPFCGSENTVPHSFEPHLSIKQTQENVYEHYFHSTLSRS